MGLKRHCYQFVPVLGLALAFLGTCHAAEDGLGMDSALFGEVPIVLTASRIMQSPLDAPAPVTTIDRETIRDSGFTEIHEIFRLVPGFLVADWPDGSPIVVNQGLGDAHSRRLLVLVDGHALYNPFKGGVDWQDLPLRLDDIERIEVVRGPNSASYGANAFQGVVNIITRVPIGEREGGVVLRAGSRDIGDVYAQMARGDGKLNWRISASARQATNFRDLGKPLQAHQEEIERQHFNGQLVWNRRPNEELNFRIAVGNGSTRVGQAEDPSDPARNTNERNLLVDAGWKQAYGENSEVSLRYFHFGSAERDHYKIFPYDPSLAPVPYLTVNRDVDVNRDDLEFQQVHAWSNTLTSLWGAGVRKDSASAPGELAGLGSIGGWQWQVFGNVDWEMTPKWLLHLGGMMEKHYNTDYLFSPRLALNYRISPLQSLRFSMGRAYRAPTIFEADAREMATWSGGVAEVEHYAYRDLKPEKLDFVELGYVGQLQPNGLRVDARVYVNRFDDLIDDQSCILDAETLAAGTLATNGCGFPAPAGYERPLGYPGKSWGNAALPFGLEPRFGHYKAFYFFNSGRIRVHGGDISLDWRQRDWGRFRLAHAITRISASGYGKDDTADPNAITKDADMELSAPRHMTSLLWSRSFGSGWRASLGAYWVGGMKWPNDGDVQPAYRRFDLHVAKQLKLFGREDELALTLQNFNAEHTEFDDYLVERRAFVTYRINY